MQATQKTDMARTLSAETIDFLSFSVISNPTLNRLIKVFNNKIFNNPPQLLECTLFQVFAIVVIQVNN